MYPMRITLHTSNYYCVAIIIGVLRAPRSSRRLTGFLAISMSVRLVIDLSSRFDWCYDLHGGHMWIIWSAIGLINAVEEEGSLSLRVRKFWLLSFDPQIQSKTAIGVLGSTRGGKFYCPFPNVGVQQ